MWPSRGDVADKRRPLPLPLNQENLRQSIVHKMNKTATPTEHELTTGPAGHCSSKSAKIKLNSYVALHAYRTALAFLDWVLLGFVGCFGVWYCTEARLTHKSPNASYLRILRQASLIRFSQKIRRHGTSINYPQNQEQNETKRKLCIQHNFPP